MISRRHQSPKLPMSVDPVRSRIMRSVGRANTKPEMIVRQMLHKLGFRFRLHRKNLPGTPDIVLLKYRTVIFVHGCFWHRHKDCSKSTTPKTRAEFWLTKFEQNRARDIRNEHALKEAGWSVLIVWECDATKPDLLERKLVEHFSQAKMT
jgi:DNA mismatch endonuclease (patch repair protein)